MARKLSLSSELRSRERIAFLEAIEKRKNVIFGSFSSTLTCKNKEEAWKEVQQETLAQGFDKFSKKPWNKVRDDCWQDLRKSTMKKFDKNQINGTASEGYNKVDLLVLSITGKDTSSLNAIEPAESEEPETSINGQQQTSVENHNAKKVDDEKYSLTVQSILEKIDNPPNISKPAKRKKFAISESDDEDVHSLKILLLQQQLMNEQLRNNEIVAKIDVLNAKAEFYRSQTK